MASEGAIFVQVVCITDPVLATHVLRSKHVDKLRFQYSFLDPVSHFPVTWARSFFTAVSSNLCQFSACVNLPSTHGKETLFMRSVLRSS